MHITRCISTRLQSKIILYWEMTELKGFWSNFEHKSMHNVIQNCRHYLKSFWYIYIYTGNIFCTTPNLPNLSKKLTHALNQTMKLHESILKDILSEVFHCDEGWWFKKMSRALSFTQVKMMEMTFIMNRAFQTVSWRNWTWPVYWRDLANNFT